MKQRILNAITAMLLILTLTMANVIMLCVDVVSYAADSIDSSTSHKNVEFMAYFKDANGNKTTSMDAKTNAEDLKLYFQVAVNKEGYFNGNIVLNNANFRLKSNILSDSVSKIENNVVYLNQINAGENKEIEVGIELLKDEQFDLNYIDMGSSVSIKGTYKDGTQKDININTDKKITLNLVRPYDSADDAIMLSQEVITNKILKVNGQEKRIVQLQVKSGLNNNLYPIKETIVNIQAPKISNRYPENVIVNANDVLTTTGKELSTDNWNYNNQTGKIEIKLENKLNNGKVSWIKNGCDNFVVTYVYDKDVEINSEKSAVDSKISLYDKKSTVYTAGSEITVTKGEKNSIVTSNIEQNETSIYKGKLYAGISRDITYRDVINVNLNNIEVDAKVKESEQTINGEKIASTYKTSKFSKVQIQKVLGQNGKLTILNSNDGNVIATINKDTVADENGNILVSYPENVEVITMKIEQTENVGKIEVETTRTIGTINKDKVRQANTIDLSSIVAYNTNGTEDEVSKYNSSIKLDETQTSADLQVSRTDLSAMTTNNNVEFRITLKSREEKNELFKNPILRLKLPSQIKNIKVNSINLVYDDELKIKSSQLDTTNNEIIIELQGEQTKYKNEAIDGATIIVNANLTTDTKIASSKESVVLTYTNENAINYENGKNVGTVSKDINIISYAGVVTTNQVSKFGIDVVNNQGNANGELKISSDRDEAVYQKRIINNKENKISNVRILGTFPTNKATDSNNINVEVNNISVTGVEQNKVKVYYSENANATTDLNNKDNKWTENLTNKNDVKKYLVVVDELDVKKEIDLAYSAVIPERLDYNQVAEENYIVYYTNITSEEKTEISKSTLSTPKGAVIDTVLRALVAGNENNEVKENGILRYAITVSNTGSEDMNNIVVTGKVPDGTTYVNSDKLNNEVDPDDLGFIDENKKDVEFNIENLAKGQTITKYYEVKVNDGMAGKEIKNTVVTKYGEKTKISNEVKTKVAEGNVEVKLVSIDATDGIVEGGYSYRYILYVTNKKDKDLKNVNVKYNTNNTAKITEISYVFNDESKTVENEDNITIDKIKAGETVEVVSYVTINKLDKDALSVMSAKVYANNTEYSSNEVNSTVASSVILEMNATSENSGGYVKSGDTIKYNIVIKNTGSKVADTVTLKNWIANEVSLTKILKNGEELLNENYTKISDNSKNKQLIKINDITLEPGQSIEYQLETTVNMVYGNKTATEIIDEISLEENSIEIANAKIQHILQPDKDFVDGNNGNGDGTNGNNNGNNSNNEENNTNVQYRIISGTAWVDANENGQKDNQEQAVEDITAKLLDVTTNKYVKDSNGNDLEAKTTSTGFYSFDRVPKGQYLVVFEYDTTKYGLTTFEKQGVASTMTSKVINKNLKINNEEKNVATTEIINVDTENIANINIGLINAKTYDLQLDKYITKVTVQNNKTVTNEYDNQTLAKAEIDAKQVNSTTVVVEYTIKVINKGDVTAYVKKIADYLSSDYKFSSELNKDWYQSGSDIYCTSLANEKLQPGESKEVKLTVIKQMKENNTGLVNNTAEIAESYNELGLKDKNSTEGNKVKGENDMGSADLIISIRTGQVVTTVLLVISSIVILGVAVYYVRRLITHRNFI